MGEKNYSGGGYGASQVIACLIFGVAGIVYGSIVLGTDFEPEKGRGLIAFLTGVAFLVALYRLVKSSREVGPTRRAVYAWAIMQQHDYSAARLSVQPQHIAIDILRMQVAAKARDGQLTLDELSALQALRPDVPYPGEWPAADRPDAAR